MRKLKIIVKERKNQNVTVYLDNNEVGIINDKMEVGLSNKLHAVHFKYGNKTSNIIKLKNTDVKQYTLEIDKAIKLERIFIVFIPLFLASFSFHKAFGIGYYFFTIVSLFIVLLTYLNWNKLIIKEVKG